MRPVVWIIMAGYDCDLYNSDEYVKYTNCYAYAFGMLEKPITGEKFPEGGNDRWKEGSVGS